MWIWCEFHKRFWTTIKTSLLLRMRGRTCNSQFQHSTQKSHHKKKRDFTFSRFDNVRCSSLFYSSSRSRQRTMEAKTDLLRQQWIPSIFQLFIFHLHSATGRIDVANNINDSPSPPLRKARIWYVSQPQSLLSRAHIRLELKFDDCVSMSKSHANPITFLFLGWAWNRFLDFGLIK